MLDRAVSRGDSVVPFLDRDREWDGSIVTGPDNFVTAIGAGELSERLPHVYVQSPRAWGLELPLDEGPPAITLAQVFPISEDEYQAWRGLGAERFEKSLIDRKIDVADLRRSGR